jgi:hypothetical protein
MDGANVTLNDVNVVGNAVQGDDGAGIAVCNGAVLTMEGGSISNNQMDETYILISYIVPFGSLYVNNATAILNKVTISDNDAKHDESVGVAIYAINSTVTMNECTVSGNAVEKNGTTAAESVIEAIDSRLIITATDFTNNATSINIEGSSKKSVLFNLENTSLVMNGGKITGNNPDDLFDIENSNSELNDVTITDNKARVMRIMTEGKPVTMTKCVLGNNIPDDANVKDILVLTKGDLVMIDCTLGDTSIDGREYVDFGNGVGTASIFGEGSLTNVLVIVSLIASCVSICLTVYYNKKKTAPVTANGADESDDEE